VVYHLVGDSDLAHASFDSARVLLEAEVESQRKDGRIHSALGVVYAGLGKSEDAIREGKLALQMLPMEFEWLHRNVAIRNLAVIYMFLGEYDSALEQIETLLFAQGSFSEALLMLDPLWDPLRNNPRYKKLIADNG
jgi:serine/threonine-protein kinase